MPGRLSQPKTQITLLVLITGALLTVGLLAVCSATMWDAVKAGSLVSGDACKQALFVLVGIIVAYAVYRLVPVSIWTGRATWVAWFVCIALIVLTALIGEKEYGAVRRICIGSLEAQPAELVKAVLVIMAAKTVEEYKIGRLTRRGLWFELGVRVVLPVVAMLVTQSDLGSSMVCLVGVIAVLYMGGLPRRDVALVCAGCVALGALAIVSSEYRLQRFLVTLNPWDDGEGGEGAGFQLIHSFYAISGGSLFGTGIGGSHEKFGRLPIASTDFIFAVIAEEGGLFGSMMVVALFVAFLWIGLVIAMCAQSSMGEMLAAGMAVSLAFQAFLNIASVIGVLPMTGKPLPFISYGGSSLVASFAMVGLIASVAHEGQSSQADYRRRRDNLRVIHVESPAPRSQTAAGSARVGRSRRPSRGYQVRHRERLQRR